MEHSKLEQVFPLEQIPFPEEMILIRVAPEEIDAMIEQLREDHLVICPTEGPVERGDFVLLSPQEGGEVRLINTARPMSAAALAEICLGKRKGEVADEYRIIGIKRQVIPAFDEALVLKEGLPEVRTPEQYRTHCLETLRLCKIKQQTGALTQWMAEEWRKRCQFCLDAEDLRSVVSELEGAADQYTKKTGQPRERLLGMFARLLGFPEDSDPDLDAYGEHLMERVLLGQYCLSKYGVVLNKSDYEKALEKMAQKKDGLPDDRRRAYPYSLFLHEKVSGQIDTEVKKFIQKCGPFRYE